MIEVCIKLVPFGMRDREHEISKITIWNDVTGTSEIGNYGYKIKIDSDEEYSGEFKGFSRKDGVLKLLQGVLNDAI